MRRVKFFQFILSFLVVLLLSATSLYAGNPTVSIDLTIGKENREPPYFNFSGKIPASVQVINTSRHDIVISKGFQSKNFFKKMRVIDPAGRLLMPQRSENGKEEFPDAPPLPFVLYKNRPVQVAPCEIFPKGKKLVKNFPDIREYFKLELPGFYSAQVQISVMIFRKDICSVKEYLWQGMLSSETIYFYFEGMTKIRIIPANWSIGWKDVPPAKPVEVQIYYETEKTWEDYDLESIRLNHRVDGKVEKQKYMLKAYFNAQECIKTIDSPRIGKGYSVAVSGNMRNRKPFGGGQKIIIIP